MLDGFSLRDRAVRKRPEALTVEEAERLIAACPRSTAGERRDRLIVLLLYGCGLRTDELCALDVPDVDTERGELRVRRGKGDRSRVVPIPSEVFTELLAHLHARGGKRGPLLRTEAKRVRLSGKAVANAVRRAAEAAQLDRPVVPKTLEAVLLHQLDLLDSRVQGFFDHLSNDNGSEDWTARSSHMFGTELRRPAGFESEEE